MVSITTNNLNDYKVNVCLESKHVINVKAKSESEACELAMLAVSEVPNITDTPDTTAVSAIAELLDATPINGQYA